VYNHTKNGKSRQNHGILQNHGIHGNWRKSRFP